ncbi:MAG: metallophosphoesterase [Chloroflexi bacterium]|nr:MAG: metallophosphoesterase [Chloroflexota bacterium]
MKLSRRDFLKTLGIVTVGGSTVIVGGYEYGKEIEAKQLVVEHIQIRVKNIKTALEGFRIVQLSDIHLYPYTQLDFVQETVTIANSLQPDLIVLTGDYVLQTAEAIFEVAPVLASLNAKYGVFSILGNHDLWTDAEIVRLGLKEQRLPLLENEGIGLTVNGEPIYLAGVADGWGGQPDLSLALGKVQSEALTILLAHEPDLADQFSMDGRISVQLSGHSHGGQVRLPLIGAPILPYLGQKYDQGLYKVNDMWLYTTRGIGLLAPVRINCPPEITEITLLGT